MLSFKVMKKIILSLLATVFIFASITPRTASAQWYNQDPLHWYLHVYDDDNPSEIFGERYTAAQVQWIIYGYASNILHAFTFGYTEPWYCIASLATGDAGECLDQIFPDDINPQSFAYPDRSITEGILEDKSLSGITYIKNGLSKLNPVNEIYAQESGFGYGKLSAIQNLWQATRDVAYSLFVVMAIILAFMVMFRVKTSPQTVVTIQSALPKLAVALILVTFSYAIAGFLIDLMYVVIGVISIFVSQATSFNSHQVFNLLTLGPYIDIPDLGITNPEATGTGIFGFVVLYGILFTITLFVTLVMSFGIITTAVVSLLFGAAVVKSGGIGGIILIVILALITLVYWWLAFRTIWMLIKAFATIILLTIVAPIQIVLGIVVPGMGFGAWLKQFIANLAVFPVVGLMFSLSFVFLWEAFIRNFSGDLASIAGRFVIGGLVTGAFGNQSWPPLLGTSGDQTLALLFLAVSFVIFTLIPKSADIIKSIITGRPFAYGSAIGETLGPSKTIGLGLLSAGFINYEQGQQLERPGYKNPIAQALRTMGVVK